MAEPTITSRIVAKELAAFADWPQADLRTRERWLIKEGIIPQGVGRRGAAPIRLRHALMLLISLGAPKAVEAPRYATKVAKFRNSEDQTLLAALEEAEDYEAEGYSLKELRLPSWSGYLPVVETIWEHRVPRNLRTESENFYNRAKRASKPGIKLENGFEIRKLAEPDPLVARYLYVDGLVVGGLHQLFEQGHLT